MITLHHCANARSFRPLWAMEELGLAYRLTMLPFPPRVRRPSTWRSIRSAPSRSFRTAPPR